MTSIYFALSGFVSRGGNAIVRSRVLVTALLLCVALVSVGSGQVPVPTSRGDNQRTGANTNETLLTPANVNSSLFGALFNYSIDYLALAQPLYVPNVNIAGQGTHNVVYVATMADSVYAFDADSAELNPTPLWWVNFTDPANGITLASREGGTLPCSGDAPTSVGFIQEGIAGTPVIDTTTGTLYVVAKTVENGTVRHRLHALDITSGAEKFGGPVLITATSTSNKGHVTNFNSLHQLNRPGLLLMNGNVYMAFGSNSCNDSNTGWLLSYSASSLTQIAAFNTSPDHGLVSIWQTGNGIAADENGNIFVETAESCQTCYDVPEGGQTYSNSVVELDPNSLTVTDYFTPYDVQFLNAHDEDLSSTGVLILPDLDGATPHELVAGGKQGYVYVLNRDYLGMYDQSVDQDLQEFSLQANTQPTQVKEVLFTSPIYWNGSVYTYANGTPIAAYPVSSGTVPLGTPVTTAQPYIGAHSPSISANGTSNGVLWAQSGGVLYAFNATTMQRIYASNLIKSRDTLPAVAHFATQTVANGKVYIATQTTLSTYGLLPAPILVAGGGQSATVLSALAPIQLQVVDPYAGVPVPGVTVTFSDGGKKGTFNPPSAVSDSNGNVTMNYTFSKTAGVYTMTATTSQLASTSFTETALPGPATQLVTSSGSGQTGQAGSILPKPLTARVKDAYNNGVPGITVTFVDPTGVGTLNPTSGVSNSGGYVSVSYQLENAVGTHKVQASAPGFAKPITFTETATGDTAAALVVVSGNNQTGPVNTALPSQLVVQAIDQGGNPVAGVAVVFSASSGTFSGSPAVTNASGQAAVNYTTGTGTGTVTITAAINGVNTQMTVNVTSGAATTVTISGGNNQTGSAGTTLPQTLSVVVTDHYSNPVPGVSVIYSDGGAGGFFSNPNPENTDNTGTAAQIYTLSPNPGTVFITASASGVTNPAFFTETGQ